MRRTIHESKTDLRRPSLPENDSGPDLGAGLEKD